MTTRETHIGKMKAETEEAGDAFTHSFRCFRSQL